MAEPEAASGQQRRPSSSLRQAELGQPARIIDGGTPARSRAPMSKMTLAYPDASVVTRGAAQGLNTSSPPAVSCYETFPLDSELLRGTS